MTTVHEIADSSNLLRVVFDPEALRLEITFRKGERRYAYEGVTWDVFAALLAAESKGRFFAEQIKPRYPFVRLDAPAVADAEVAQ